MASRATLAFVSLALCAAVVAGDTAAEGGRQLLSQSNENSQTQVNEQSTGNFAAIFSPFSPFSTVGLTQVNKGSNYNYQGQTQAVNQANFGRKLQGDQTNSNSQTQVNQQSAGNYAAIFNPFSPFSAVGLKQVNLGSNYNYQSQGQNANQGNFGRKLQGDQTNSNSQTQQNVQTAGNYFSLYVPTSIIAAHQSNKGGNLNFQFQQQAVNQQNFGRKLQGGDQTNSNSQTQVNSQTAGNYFSVAVPFGLIKAAQINGGNNVNYQWQQQAVNQQNFGRKLLDQTNDNSQTQYNSQSAGNYAVLHFPYDVVLKQYNAGSNYNTQIQGQWVQQANFGRKLLDQTNSNSQTQYNSQSAGNYAVLHFPYDVVLNQFNAGSNSNQQVQGQWVYQTNVKG